MKLGNWDWEIRKLGYLEKIWNFENWETGKWGNLEACKLVNWEASELGNLETGQNVKIALKWQTG